MTAGTLASHLTLEAGNIWRCVMVGRFRNTSVSAVTGLCAASHPVTAYRVTRERHSLWAGWADSTALISHVARGQSVCAPSLANSHGFAWSLLTSALHGFAKLSNM